MSCLNALHSQIDTFFSVPHDILLLRHRVFREYAKVALGPDFVHTFPSFIVLAAMLLILRRNPPQFGWLAQILGMDFPYRVLQVSVGWVLVNAIFWLWLIFQRILYCTVWSYWSQDSEEGEISYPWWQKVWASYYPAPLQPPILSAEFISWIISMAIATTTLGCAIFTRQARRFLNVAEKVVVKIIRYTGQSSKRLKEAVLSQDKEITVEDCSEISSVCDDCRSEFLSDGNNAVPEVRPISYGTNWFSRTNGSKETKRKVSMKSLHTVAGPNVAQQAEISPRQLRHRRGCHTVIPSNSSDKSSGC